MIKDFVALDLETTGVSLYNNKIIEIGAVRYRDGKEVARYETFVYPKMPISSTIQEITGIDNDMVKDSPVIEDIIEDVLSFIGDDILLGHNIRFDYGFIAKAALDKGIVFRCKGVDTFKISYRCHKDIESRSLEYLCNHYGIETVHHRATADAISSAAIYFKMCEKIDSDKDIFELTWTPKKQEKITHKQLSYLSSLIKRHKIQLDKKIEDLSKSEASREIDRILSTYGMKK